MRRTVLTAALALTAATALAGPSPAPPNAPPSDPTAAAAFYPPAAKAAGVAGEATIRCGRDAGMALRDCTLVSEAPAGQGFGQAALAMAAASPDNPKLHVADAALRQPRDYRVAFSLNPTALTPNLAVMTHLITNPDYRERPNVADINRYYPTAAAKAHQSGYALVRCRINLAGEPVDCFARRETPPGQDFGAAAIRIISHFNMKPQLFDGVPTDRGTLQIPITFSPAPR